MTINDDKLKLNLQFFAEDGANGGAGEGEGSSAEGGNQEPNDPPKDPGTEGGKDGGGEGGNSNEGMIPKSEVNRIVQERLARDRKEREDAEEAKRLEAQGEYKELLDKANEKIAEYERKEAAREKMDSIEEKLIAKGVGAEDVKRYAKYADRLAEDIDGVDDAVEEVYGDFIAAKQASSGDPNAGFGDSKEPTQKGADELGRSLYQQIRGK